MKLRRRIPLALAFGFVAYSGLSATPAAADPAFSWTAPTAADHQPPYADYRPLADVSCPTESLCVAVAPSRNGEGGNIVTSTNPTGGSASNWTLAAISNDFGFDINDVSCPSASLCVAVGSSGTILTSTNPTGGPSAWTPVRISSSSGLFGVSCASASLCVAVGAGGNIVTSTNPTGGAAAWTLANIDGNHLLNGVSCAPTSLCVAVDVLGNVATSTNPTGGAAAWTLATVDGGRSLNGVSCPSSSLCVAADGLGNVATSTNPTGGAAAWTLANVDGNHILNDVSCTSDALCVAGDSTSTSGANVVTSTNPSGGAAAWTVANADPSTEPAIFSAQIVGVSCPSASLCVAVDGYGNAVTSTNPTGGAAAWTTTKHVDGMNSLTGISCPTESLCVAADKAGNVVTSTSPTAGESGWTVSNVGGSTDPCCGGQAAISGISCPSASLCVASDSHSTLGGPQPFRILASTDPAGGAAAWTITPIPGASLPGGAPACASESLCVALDNGGRVITSTNPSGGAGSWTVTTVDSGHFLSGASCPSLSLCVAVDTAGNVVTSTDPSGGAGAWTVTNVDGSNPLTGITCSSESLCVAVDLAGNAVSSTNPTGGASAWTVTHTGASAASQPFSAPFSQGDSACANGPAGAPCGVSCPSVSVCAGVNNSGDALTTTTPTAGGWASENVDGAALLGISCASTSLCVTVDRAGRVVVGTPAVPHTLSVTKPGAGTGTVTSAPSRIDCGTTCSAQFNQGTSVVLTAAPAPGSSFAGWSGGGCSGTGSCGLTINGDETVNATFNVVPPPPPNTKISKAKINSKKGTASFKFKSTGTKATGFQCALVKKASKHHKIRKPRFKKCRSPKTYKRLKRAKYTFEVRALSAAGKDRTPAKKKFKIEQ